MMKRLMLLAIGLLFGLMPTLAQDIAPVGTVDTSVFGISFPPPVYVLSGETAIEGSVNLPGLTNYFIEFRPLEVQSSASAATPNPDRPWFPATLPSNLPVSSGVLGTWNTITAPDGIYEMRLTALVQGQIPQYFRVSPIRVDNTRAQAAPLATLAPLRATPTQLGFAPVPTSSAFGTPVAPVVATTPRVVALTGANVRQGDTTAYDRIGGLLAGEAADLLGVSNTGTGWYYIQLGNGRRGFVAPSAVRVEGNTAALQQVAPPAPPATPTPAATATPVRPANAGGNLLVTGIRPEPNPPACGQSYTLYINITNAGSSRTAADSVVLVLDRHVRTNTISQTSVVLPPIDPGTNYVLTVALKSDAGFNEDHTIEVTADNSNVLAEDNENDNVGTFSYVLTQGSC